MQPCVFASSLWQYLQYLIDILLFDTIYWPISLIFWGVIFIFGFIVAFFIFDFFNYLDVPIAVGFGEVVDLEEKYNGSDYFDPEPGYWTYTWLIKLKGEIVRYSADQYKFRKGQRVKCKYAYGKYNGWLALFNVES